MKSLLAFVSLAVAAQASIRDASTCTCGFYDEAQDNLWTDSIVVYFNETGIIPDNWVRQDYRNRWEQGWNSQFIQGAATNNSWIDNSTSATHGGLKSLQLFVSPADYQHVVVGGAIRSQRQDIQYGSFRSYMKGAKNYTGVGGTSLSMTLEYNLTQQISLNIQNTNSNETGWVSTLMNHEFPNRILGVNYTNVSSLKPVPNFNASPVTDLWREYNDMRIDWTPTVINYWLGNNLSRNVSGADYNGADRPSVPVPLTFKHWSDGNEYAMGKVPPMNFELEANVLYIRAFFNTSSMNATGQEAFNARCSKTDACLTENFDLRGSTPYPPEATNAWVQAEDGYTIRWPAIAIMALCLFLSISTLANVILRRVILPSKPKEKSSPAESVIGNNNSSEDMSFTSGGTTPLAAHRSPIASGYATPARTLRDTSAATSSTFLPGSAAASIREHEGVPPVPRLPNGSIQGSPYASHAGSKLSLFRGADATGEEIATTPLDLSLPATPFSPTFPQTKNLSFIGRPPTMVTYAPAVIGDSGNEEVVRNGVIAENVKGKTVPISSSAAPAGEAASGGAKPAPRQKIDYLAGLLAFCSTLVSLTHYMLTFLPAVIEPNAYAHYDSENWARKTVGWFFFNEIWVVLFFTTSSRFLTTKYLRTGDLSVIAEKTTSRTFRLMIPIIGVIFLEYFLMDVGALDWLQYLPSIGWSTWPYTVVYENFGSFISETLELIYVIPNAQPQITFNYCTGVLWTIPVQLDGSWTAMLGAIVFYELKTPWKRFSYYFVVILTHWYARSWGGLFIAGLCMADLDVTYKYRKSLYANKWLYYPLLNVVILVALISLGNDLLSQWTGINFQTIEDGWHIDKLSGLALIQAGNSGFPPYYIPKLNSLTFAVTAQLLVEWSTVLQKIISIKVILWLFPHIFTIYLFHGFIFWSVGSAVCVAMGAAGAPYWANMIITFIACYATLYLALPIITPVVEALGKSATTTIWSAASEQPAPKRATTFPFPKDLFTSRNVDNPTEGSDTMSSASSFTENMCKGGPKSTSTTDSSASSFIDRPPTADEATKWPLATEKPVHF